MESAKTIQLDELLKELKPEIQRIVSYRISNPEDAKDITQEVMIRIFRHVHRFYGSSPEAPIKAWVNQIIKNLCIDYHRRKREYFPIDEAYFLSSRENIEKQFENLEFELKLKQALTQLPSYHRNAFVLKYFENKSLEEIASLLNVPINTAKSYIHRAKKSLQGHLVDYYQYAS